MTALPLPMLRLFCYFASWHPADKTPMSTSSSGAKAWLSASLIDIAVNFDIYSFNFLIKHIRILRSIEYAMTFQHMYIMNID